MSKSKKRRMKNMADTADYQRGCRIIDQWRKCRAEHEAKRRADGERERRERGEFSQILAWARGMDPARMARLACAGTEAAI